MRLRRIGVVMALVLITVGIGSAVPIGDAGTGEDAGDSPGQATELSDEGTYDGILVPPGDADWYTLTSSKDRPRCYQAMVGGGVLAEVTLSLDPSLVDATTRPIAPGLALDLGLAAPATSQVFLGFEPRETPAPSDEAPSSSGPYRFDLQTLELGSLEPGDDAGSGMDAGPTPDDAINVTSACFGGHVGKTGDHADTYAFTIGGDERLTVSLTQSDDERVIKAALLSPRGDNETQLTSGEITEVTTDEAGTWALKLWTSPSDNADMGVDYLVGLTINGPEPPPCRPGCATFVETT